MPNLNAHYYIDHIIGNLFAAEDRRFTKAYDRLSEENQQMIGHRLDGFMYAGVFYRHSQALAGSGERRTLHLDLWPAMQDILADKTEVTNDVALIKQCLFRLIEPCLCFSGNQHIRDAIPDCIIDTAPPEIASMERMGSPIGSLNHIRDIKLYNKTLPKMEFYSAARLIY